MIRIQTRTRLQRKYSGLACLPARQEADCREDTVSRRIQHADKKPTAEELSQHDQRADKNLTAEEIQRLGVFSVQRRSQLQRRYSVSVCLMARQEVDCRGRCSVSAHSECRQKVDCRGDSSVAG